MDRYPIILDDTNQGQIRIIRTNAQDRDLLHVWYDALECTCIEHVRTMIPGIHLIIDESGNMTDPPKPLNSRATSLYAGAWYGDPIVGHAIICSIGMRNGEPDFVPPSDADLRTLARFTGWHIPGLALFEGDL